MKLRRPLCFVSLLGVASVWAFVNVAPQSENALVDPAPIVMAQGSASVVGLDAWAAAQPFLQIFSVASTRNARLDTCVDFIVEVVPPEGADSTWVPEAPSDLHKKLAKLGRTIDRPCLEQFANRSALATCVTTSTRSAQTLRLVERYYDYSTVGVDDARMEDCLRLGGDWQAVAKNSPEFQHAKRTAIVQEFEAMAQGT